MTNDVSSVYQATNSLEAYLVHNRLTDEGIESQVTESAAYAGLTFAPCHVLVRTEDKQRARQIIDQIERERAESFGDTPEADD